jgi:hypothetical protein
MVGGNGLEPATRVPEAEPGGSDMKPPGPLRTGHTSGSRPPVTGLFPVSESLLPVSGSDAVDQ